MIVFKVLIVVFVVVVWRLTYPTVALWINNHVNFGSQDTFKKINKDEEEK